MKITKDELKDIIRECLEEQGIVNEANKYNYRWHGGQKTDTGSNLKENLIEVAKHNKFTEKDNKYYEDNFMIKDIKNYKCGYCWADASGNPIVYSFSKNKFYFIDHESFDSMPQSEVSIGWIKKYIDKEEQ